MKFLKTELGHEYQNPQIIVMFGNKDSQLSRIQEAYPQFTFKRLKQIHSDAVVKTTATSPDYEVIADAHYSSETQLGLISITADCIPLFIYDPKTLLIAAAHAGWRGVAAKISVKTIKELVNQGAQPQDLQVFIGPHIQKNSFEVEFDVRDQILSSIGPLSPLERQLFAEDISTTKSLVDIHQVIRYQLQKAGVQIENIHSLHIDTVQDESFHSYRRDKKNSGRQISFIARII